jgi:hypothetical protein
MLCLYTARVQWRSGMIQRFIIFFKVRSLFHEIYESITKFPSPLNPSLRYISNLYPNRRKKRLYPQTFPHQEKTIYVKLLWFHPFLWMSSLLQYDQLDNYKRLFLVLHKLQNSVSFFFVFQMCRKWLFSILIYCYSSNIHFHWLFFTSNLDSWYFLP